jgi:DNA-binding transcriptional LysR family regulator
MQLRKWRYMVVAAEEGNFGRAASRLHVSQPALSQQIHELEQELGVLLFDRLPRGVRLSQAGSIFLAEAQRVIAAIDEAVDRTQRAARGELGTLRIAYNETSGQRSLVAQSLKRFSKSCPEIALKLIRMHGSHQQEALRRDEIDLGFHHVPESATSPEWMDTYTLETHRLVLAISKRNPLAARSTLTIKDLSECQFISSIYGHWESQFSAYRQHWFSSMGIVPRRLMETGSESAVLNLASVDMGIGIVLSPHPQLSTLVYRDLPGEPRRLNMVIAWRRERASVQLMDFVSAVQQSRGQPIAQT